MSQVGTLGGVTKAHPSTLQGTGAGGAIVMLDHFSQENIVETDALCKEEM